MFDSKVVFQFSPAASCLCDCVRCPDKQPSAGGKNVHPGMFVHPNIWLDVHLLAQTNHSQGFKSTRKQDRIHRGLRRRMRVKLATWLGSRENLKTSIRVPVGYQRDSYDSKKKMNFLCPEVWRFYEFWCQMPVGCPLIIQYIIYNSIYIIIYSIYIYIYDHEEQKKSLTTYLFSSVS